MKIEFIMEDGTRLGFSELTGINSPKTDEKGLKKAAKSAMKVDSRIIDFEIK